MCFFYVLETISSIYYVDFMTDLCSLKTFEKLMLAGCLEDFLIIYTLKLQELVLLANKVHVTINFISEMVWDPIYRYV